MDSSIPQDFAAPNHSSEGESKAQTHPENHAELDQHSARPTPDPTQSTDLSSKEPTASQESADPSDNAPADSQGPADESGPDECASDTRSETDGQSVQAPEPGSIEDFALRSQRARLPAEEEAQATAVLGKLLLGGRADVARAVLCIPKLPWMVVTQATTGAWPEMKASFRTQMLAGLAKSEGEAAARIRLSLARGLFKIDHPAALKLIILTLRSMRDRASGLLTGKGAAHFAGVLIGRGKAWILQVPTESLKPAEVELLVHSALHGAFHAPQPPLTQIHTLKWAMGLLGTQKLPAAIEDLLLKSITRWSSKWQGVLKREIKDLPETWLNALKPQVSTGPAEAEAEGSGQTLVSNEEQNQQTEGEAPAPKHRKSRHAPKGDKESHKEPQQDSEAEQEISQERADEGSKSGELDEDGAEDGVPEKKPHRDRPVYVSKTIPSHSADSGARADHNQGANLARRGGQGAGFNLHETLRQIEAYASNLRVELASAQKQLRSAEEIQKRSRRTEKPVPLTVPGSPSLDELSRLNQQLEFRNAELKARIEELTLDSEQRATSLGLAEVQPKEIDPCLQLKTLLAFKLQEDFEDFHALEQQAKDIVVQQHYKTVLKHVFEVLQSEGIISDPPTPPAPQQIPLINPK